MTLYPFIRDVLKTMCCSFTLKYFVISSLPHLILDSLSELKPLVTVVAFDYFENGSKEITQLLPLKVHSCRFENLPVCSYSHKINSLNILHS